MMVAARSGLYRDDEIERLLRSRVTLQPGPVTPATPMPEEAE